MRKNQFMIWVGPLFLSLIGMAASLSAVAHAQTTATANDLSKATDGWTSLFDGKSLKSWYGDPKFWSVQDGALTGTTTEANPTRGNTFLIYSGGNPDNSPVEYGDFELKLKYRVTGHNSGIQYRSFIAPGERDDWRVGGYQADMDAANEMAGAIYGERFRRLLAGQGEKATVTGTQPTTLTNGRTVNTAVRKVAPLSDTEELRKAMNTAPEWNEMHIIAKGYHFIQKINGVTISELIDKDEANRRASGLIAIQLHGGPPMTVQVKDVRIKGLEAVSPRSAANRSAAKKNGLDAKAQLSVPHFFSDHMVLQQGKVVKVWGRTTPGKEVTVQFRDASSTTQSVDDGKWELHIQSGSATSDGQRLVIQSGDEEIAIQDVLVGEVWFAAGQSNMMWKLRDSANPSEAIAAADHPRIRMFHSPEVTAEPPQDDIEGQWTICSPKTADDYSAVAYYYARKLQQELNVPVGVIVSAWGAKRIESFISREALSSRPETRGLLETLFRQESIYDPAKALADYEQRKAAFDQWLAEGRLADKPRPRPAREKPQRPLLSAHQPGVLFNSMIHPFIGYGIQGVIWYQGESNARPKLVPYDILLTMLIQDWRKRWGYDFPFYFVQLANFRAPTREPGVEDPWPLLRDRMRRVLDCTPKTGMAVIHDTGEENNIHPYDKQTPGERLARWALAKTYEKDIVYSGPLYKSFAIEKETLRIRFSSVGKGLRSQDGRPLQRFEIAGADRKWHWAEARIVGSNQVKLSHPDVPDPIAARYAWASNPKGANLVNSEGLPASVFRTDDQVDENPGLNGVIDE